MIGGGDRSHFDQPSRVFTPCESARMTPCPSCGADRGHLLGCEFSTISLAPAAPQIMLDEPAEDTSRARAWGVPIALGAAAADAWPIGIGATARGEKIVISNEVRNLLLPYATTKQISHPMKLGSK